MEKSLGDKDESLGDKNESLGDKNGNSHPLFYGSFMWEWIFTSTILRVVYVGMQLHKLYFKYFN